MSIATIAVVGDEVACAVPGGPEARFPIADASAKLKAWAQRYDAASWRDAEGELAAIGVEMFAWLDSTNRWATGWLARPGERALEVRVEGRGTDAETALLDAPWELLVGPRGPLAADPLHLFVPYRRVGAAAPPRPAEVGDLRVMFMAASPGNAADLDFEAEETGILDATARLPLHLTVEETGALEFLSERLSTEGPFEVLHLSCHGTIDPAAGPALVLEDAAGKEDLAGTDRIAEALGARPPALLVLSACRTAEHGRAQGGKALPGYRDEGRRQDAGSAPMPAVPLARQLAEVAANVVGWDGSVYDADATAFAHHFYGELAKAVTVQRAAGSARKHLLQEKARSGAGRHWHLARVYVGAGGGGPLCDNRRPKRTVPLAPERAFLDQERRDVPVATRSEFVGRRRAIQALLRAYRDGISGALIHGMGALGKSSLAARAVSRLATLRPVVVFKRYDALAVFDRIAERLPPTLRQGEVARWREQVRGDASLLADALESWLAGPFAAHPILLVIDDLERILETPLARAAPVSVELAFRPVVSAVLIAFGRAADASRLLLTSRYNFQLLDGYGSDLAGPLARVPLQAMAAPERNKQWRAARRVEDREGETNQRVRDLRDRALAAASGNPGLQATLTKPILSGLFDAAETAIIEIEGFLRTGVPPAEVEAAIESGQAKDRDNAIVAFFRRVSFDVYRRALNDDQQRQMAASAFFSPDVPIPVAALAAVGAALGIEEAEAAVMRLIGLGLLDDFGKVDGHRHAALNPLARPLASTVSAEDEVRLARAALPALTSTRQKNGMFPTDSCTLEIARLAIICQADPILIEKATVSAASFLKYQKSSPQSAFLLVVSSIDLFPNTYVFDPNFLRLAIECSDDLGQTHLVDWALSATARPCLSDSRSELGSHAALDLRRAEILIRRGDTALAEAATRNALAVFRSLDSKNMIAISISQMADIEEHYGDLDEALRLHIEDELKIFEELGDLRSQAITMSKIADILEARGNINEALNLRREHSLPIFQRLGDVREHAVLMGKIANSFKQRGEFDEALDIHKNQVPVFDRIGDLRAKSISLHSISQLLLLMDGVQNGRFQEIYDALEEAFAIAVHLRAPSGIGSVGLDFAQVLAVYGRAKQSLSVLTQVEVAFTKLGQANELAKCEELRNWIEISMLIHDKG